MLMILLLPLWLHAQTYDSVQKVDNPRLHHGWTTDAARLMSTDERARVDALIDSINKDLGVEIAVVTLPSIGQRVPKEFATELFNTWGIGRKKTDDGLLILVVVDQRRIEMETGYGVEGALPDILLARIQRDEMIPKVKAGRAGEAIVAGVERVTRAIREGGVQRTLLGMDYRHPGQAEAFAAVTALLALISFFLMFRVFFRRDPYQRYAGIRQRFGWLFFWQLAAIFAVVTAVVAYAEMKPVLLGLEGGLVWCLFGSTIRFGWSALARRRPRVCTSCGAPMVKQDDVREKAHETANEQIEEKIGSLDYDVWVCPSGHVRKDAYDGKRVADFDDCPKCKARTRKLQLTETIKPATYRASGRGLYHFLCLACNAKTTETFILAQLRDSSSSGGGSSGGGGGGSSSFSGGSSGGGGAGSSW